MKKTWKGKQYCECYFDAVEVLQTTFQGCCGSGRLVVVRFTSVHGELRFTGELVGPVLD